MVVQVLLRDLPFGDIDIGCCRHIVFPNNSPRHYHRVLTSENPSEAINFCVPVSEDIPRVMAVNFFIWPRPSSSGLGVIKAKD